MLSDRFFGTNYLNRTRRDFATARVALMPQLLAQGSTPGAVRLQVGTTPRQRQKAPRGGLVGERVPNERYDALPTANLPRSVFVNRDSFPENQPGAPAPCEKDAILLTCPVAAATVDAHLLDIQLPQNFHHGRGSGGSGGTMSFTFMTRSRSWSISYLIREARFLSDSSPNV